MKVSSDESIFIENLSYSNLVHIMDELEKCQQLKFEVSEIKYLLGLCSVILNRIDWITHYIIKNSLSLANPEKQENRRKMFYRFFFTSKNVPIETEDEFRKLLEKWQVIRKQLIPETLPDNPNFFDKVGVRLLRMRDAEIQLIDELSKQIDRLCPDADTLIFYPKTGQVQFRGNKVVLAQPETFQFVVLKNIMSARHKSMKNIDMYEKLSDWEEEHTGEHVSVDKRQKRCLYSTRSNINKKFRNNFSVDFDLIEIKNCSVRLSKRVQVRKLK